MPEPSSTLLRRLESISGLRPELEKILRELIAGAGGGGGSGDPADNADGFYLEGSGTTVSPTKNITVICADGYDFILDAPAFTGQVVIVLTWAPVVITSALNDFNYQGGHGSTFNLSTFNSNLVSCTFAAYEAGQWSVTSHLRPPTTIIPNQYTFRYKVFGPTTDVNKSQDFYVNGVRSIAAPQPFGGGTVPPELSENLFPEAGDYISELTRGEMTGFGGVYLNNFIPSNVVVDTTPGSESVTFEVPLETQYVLGALYNNGIDWQYGFKAVLLRIQDRTSLRYSKASGYALDIADTVSSDQVQCPDNLRAAEILYDGLGTYSLKLIGDWDGSNPVLAGLEEYDLSSMVGNQDAAIDGDGNYRFANYTHHLMIYWGPRDMALDPDTSEERLVPFSINSELVHLGDF